MRSIVNVEIPPRLTVVDPEVLVMFSIQAKLILCKLIAIKECLVKTLTLSLIKPLYMMALVLVLDSCGSDYDEPVREDDNTKVKGYFVKESNVNQNMTINSSINANMLSAYIQQQSKSSASSSKTLAQKIISVSDCFGIDPFIYAGLIDTESNFKISAVSPTGAVGLTQFTSSGIREVNDQLGARGTRHARKEVTNYFDKIIASCVPTTLKSNSAMHLWKYYRSINEIKSVLRNDSNRALVYGAVMLKTLLAYTYSSNRQMNSIYIHALRLYNGEPGVRSSRYADKVMNTAKKLGLNNSKSYAQESKGSSSTTFNDNSESSYDGETIVSLDDVYLKYLDGFSKGRPEKSEDVRVLQSLLKYLGYPITVDGYYGNDTTVIVEQFQRDNNLPIDRNNFRYQDWNILLKRVRS
ncbi:MAG: peptidoglycan-binding protein [Bdellovibrionota bacterium]